MATLDAAMRALAAWDIRLYGDLEEMLVGRVFKVRQKSGRSLILKDVGQQSLERLVFECDVLGHLYAQGIPVAVPIKTREGRPLADFEGSRFTLTPCLLAEDAEEPGEWVERVPSYGETFACLHLALATYPNTVLAATTWSSDPFGETFDRYVPNLLRVLPAARAAKIAAIASAIEGGMRRALDGLPMQLIHRDLHDGNILCSGDRVVGIVDCDHFSLGTPMIDIAYFLHHTVKWIKEEDGTMVGNEGGKEWWFSWVPNLLRAYDEVRPLSKRARAALPYLMVWVIISFVDLFFKKNDFEEMRLYLNLLDFVYVYRSEIGRCAISFA